MRTITRNITRITRIIAHDDDAADAESIIEQRLSRFGMQSTFQRASLSSLIGSALCQPYLRFQLPQNENVEFESSKMYMHNYFLNRASIVIVFGEMS
jgi:hypothetical protein